MSGRGLRPPRHAQDAAAAALAKAEALMGAGDAMPIAVEALELAQENEPKATEALALAQAALPAAGGAITGHVSHSGQLEAGIAPDLPSTGTVTVDFDGPMLASTPPLTGAVTFTGANMGAGRTVTVRVRNGATARAVGFPADWKIASKPDSIDANAVGVLTLTCFGSTHADVVGAWVVIPA